LPSLTVRLPGSDARPVRVVASRNLRLPKEGPLFETAGDPPVWVVCSDRSLQSEDATVWRDRGAKVLGVATDGGQIIPAAMMSALGGAGLTRVFCEGGGMLAASLLSHGLVDDLYVFSAGKFIGAEGQPSVGPLGLSTLDQAPGFDLAEVRSVGPDVIQVWRARKAATSL
jgi:diaminohydroxyphosphoribosylaminopyrimidine deaminase/5-amino-6-(5-phosphoribosylamino)uracil reductase